MIKALIKTPDKSVMLITHLLKDPRLGKRGGKRAVCAIIYSLLRRTLNLSANNINKHYSKKFHAIYCVNQITTLEDRSGFGHSTISNALSSLEKCGYIIRKPLKHRHITLIFMPKVKSVKGQLLSIPTSSTKETGLIHSKDEARLLNSSLCNDHSLNDQIHNDHVVDGNKQHHSQNNSKNNKLIKGWVNKTPKNYDIPKSVTKYIGNYLIKHHLSYKLGSKCIRTITHIKESVNRKYRSTYGSDYWTNEDNPYIQKGSLLSSLQDIFNKGLNFRKTIDKDYRDYISMNSNLKLKNIKSNQKAIKDQKMYSSLGSSIYISNLDDIRRRIKNDYQNHNQKKLVKDERDLERWGRLASIYHKYYFNNVKDIMGTKEWKQAKYAKRNPRLIQKIKTRIRYLHQNEPTNMDPFKAINDVCLDGVNLNNKESELVLLLQAVKRYKKHNPDSHKFIDDGSITYNYMSSSINGMPFNSNDGFNVNTQINKYRRLINELKDKGIKPIDPDSIDLMSFNKLMDETVPPFKEEIQRLDQVLTNIIAKRKQNDQTFKNEQPSLA